MKLSPLKPGDTIGVMAPSSYVEAQDIELSKTLLEERGYEVFIHPQTFEQHQQSAGTHRQKAQAFHELWERNDIKTIWTAGGGNRALHLLEFIDFDRLANTPKTIIGFSDATALLNAVYARANIPTLHGPVFKQLHKIDPEQLSHTLAILAGETPSCPTDNVIVLKEGKAEGHLVGGCLSIFQYLLNTADCPDLEGAILFLEDTGDHLSRIDRMFLHLKRSGVFEKINGLILGEFHDMQEGKRPYGFKLEELINEYTEEQDIPIILNAPFGHGRNLYTFIIGRKAFLDTSGSELKTHENPFSV